MITIGIDASTKSTGWSVFEDNKLINYGVIKTDNDNWRDRLVYQAKELGELFDLYKPTKVYMEDVPLNLNGGAKVVVMLGAVQGMIYGVGASRDIEMVFIQPSAWRSPLGLYNGKRDGTKRAELKKKSVEKANELFGLDLEYKSPSSKYNCDDISDAILLCYSQVKSRAFGKK